MESPYQDLWWRFRCENYFLWKSHSGYYFLWESHSGHYFLWDHIVDTTFCENHIVDTTFCENNIVDTTFCENHIVDTNFCFITHYDVTIGNGVTRNSNCDIIMALDVVIGTYHDVTMHNNIARTFMYYTLLHPIVKFSVFFKIVYYTLISTNQK